MLDKYIGLWIDKMEKGFNFRFYNVDNEKEGIVEKALQDQLNLFKKSYLYNSLSYVVKEVMGNANKSNLKRVYFKYNQLEIEKDADYQKGICL